MPWRKYSEVNGAGGMQEVVGKAGKGGARDTTKLKLASAANE